MLQVTAKLSELSSVGLSEEKGDMSVVKLLKQRKKGFFCQLRQRIGTSLILTEITLMGKK